MLRAPQGQSTKISLTDRSEHQHLSEPVQPEYELHRCVPADRSVQHVAEYGHRAKIEGQPALPYYRTLHRYEEIEV